MLENETLLQVLYFADYKTLVSAKLAGRRFLRLAIKFAEHLAGRQRFKITFFTTYIRYDNVTAGVEDGNIRYEPGNQPSLAAACRKLDQMIGPHAVAYLALTGNTWNVLSVSVIFESVSPLKCAEDVVLFCMRDSNVRGNFDGVITNFSGMRSLSLWLDKGVFCQLSWTLLRQECARDLRHIKVCTRPSASDENIDRSVEEIAGSCATFPRLLDEEALELDFTQIDFPVAFAVRIIGLLKNSGCELTFRMVTRDGDALILDEHDYTAEVDNDTTRYTSDETGIKVEVKGHSITIRSTAEVPTKKRSRRDE